MPGIVIAAVWKAGYYALMVLAALKSIDSTCYEAADIDGASGFKTDSHYAAADFSDLVF